MNKYQYKNCTMSEKNLYMYYCLITNHQLMDIKIDEKNLHTRSKALFDKVIKSLNTNDEEFFLYLMKIKHLIHYIIFCEINTITQFNENIDNLLKYSRDCHYIDIEIHNVKKTFNIISNTIFSS